MFRAWSMGALLVMAGGCQESEGPRTYEDREAGYRYTLPQGWRGFMGEPKSPRGTLMTVQVKSLVGADRTFVAGLPESVIPQLRGWTSHYFGTYASEERQAATLGGEPALELIHTVTVRTQSKPSQVRYWAARHGDLLYLVRVTYPSGRDAAEDASVRQLLGSWTYLEAPTSPAPSPS